MAEPGDQQIPNALQGKSDKMDEETVTDNENLDAQVDDSLMDESNEDEMHDIVTTTMLPQEIPVLRSGAAAIARQLSEEQRRYFKNYWSFRSYRLALTCVLCLAMVANTWGRNTLSMAMVCMVNATAVSLGKVKINRSLQDGFDECGNTDLGIAADYGGDIVWSSSEQGFLFSAVFWAGALVGIPGGWVISRYGSKRIVTLCLILTLICTLVTPAVAIYGGLLPTFIVRFVMGFGGQTLINTAITVIISQWIPPSERSTTLALYTSGNQIAVIVAMPVNAALCQNKDFLGGWPSIFYVSGVITLVATIVWQIFIDDTPAKSRWIKHGERSYIEKSLQSQNLGSSKKDVMKHVPWRQMLLSNPLWSCVATNFAAGLVAATLQSYIPTYYKEALHIDLKSNGLYSALPFLTQWIAKMFMAVAADAMKKKTKISHTVICKGFNTLGTVVASIFLIGCAFMNCKSATWAIVLLSLANASFSGVTPGYITALICIAPAYTGVVNSIARVASQVSSIVAPYIVGAVTPQGTAEEWRIVFYLMGGMMALTGIYFLLAGSVKIQDWAKVGQRRPKTSMQQGCPAATIVNELSDGNNNSGQKGNALGHGVTFAEKIAHIGQNESAKKSDTANAENGKAVHM